MVSIPSTSVNHDNRSSSGSTAFGLDAYEAVSLQQAR